jgi:hypothetical protein
MKLRYLNFDKPKMSQLLAQRRSFKILDTFQAIDLRIFLHEGVPCHRFAISRLTILANDVHSKH